MPMPIDYSKYSDDALNIEIASRIKRDDGTFWYDHDYLHDNAATWRALCELGVVLGHFAWIPQWEGARLMRYVWVEWQGEDQMTHRYEDPDPARAVWIAWLAWKDAQERRA